MTAMTAMKPTVLRAAHHQRSPAPMKALIVLMSAAPIEIGRTIHQIGRTMITVVRLAKVCSLTDVHSDASPSRPRRRRNCGKNRSANARRNTGPPTSASCAKIWSTNHLM